MDGDDLPEIDPQSLARAEAALAALADHYRSWAAADLVRLRAALTPFRPDTLFAIAHDIKGQAGTFGFPLVTERANALCRILEGRPAPEQAAALVDALAEAMAEIPAPAQSVETG